MNPVPAVDDVTVEESDRILERCGVDLLDPGTSGARKTVALAWLTNPDVIDPDRVRAGSYTLGELGQLLEGVAVTAARPTRSPSPTG